MKSTFSEITFNRKFRI